MNIYGGRKPKGEHKRSEIIQVRVTKEERAKIEETAAYYSLTVTDLIRKALGL